VHALFAEQARRTPAAPALIADDLVLSYAELDARAERLSRRLMRAGIGDGDFVAVYLERSVELVIAFLAILKSGAAYLPLSTAHPDERNLLMIEDAGARVIIASGTLPETWRTSARTIVDPSIGGSTSVWTTSPADDTEVVPPTRSLENECASPDSAKPAYVMYTSGSTGRPKGVVVPHRAIVRLVRGQSYARFDSTQRFLLLASPAFDASTFELWGPLLNGAACVVFTPRWPDLEQIERTVRAQGVTCLWLTAGLFNQIIDERPGVLASVQHVLAGGDALSVAHVRRALDLLPRLKITNGYGPTESTTFACTMEITREVAASAERIPIGRPIAHTTCVILDPRGRPVPIGVPGELHIGGDGLANGYLGDSTRTDERFVPDKFAAEPGARLYRTGDRCRWRPDGTIDFLGRLDDQVKIRGFRIEPGEIEAALAALPEIAQAALVVREDLPGGKQLAAYVVTRGKTEASALARTLRDRLAATLPDYMLPASFTMMDRLPLTANGKVDKRRLPPPSSARSYAQSAHEKIAPRSGLEVEIAAIWSELLGVSDLGVHDNFFDRGGHSLLAMRLVLRLRRALSLEIPLRYIFESPTVVRMAESLGRSSAARPPGPVLNTRAHAAEVETVVL
ncbi:MAG: amino acid adenylation domain-containing protein, partial [Opitutaceae bacterium]